MGKVKYSVAKFVQTMTGNTVVIDSGIDGPLAVGMVEYEKLEAMQAKLATYGVTSDALADAMTKYSSDAEACLLETDKVERTKAFNRLIKGAKATAQEFSGQMASWLDQAKRQKALDDGIRQGIATRRQAVASVGMANIRTALSARLDALETQIVLGKTVAELPETLPVLERLADALPQSGVDRYADMAERFTALNAALTQTIADTRGPVGGLQPSELGKLMAARLTAVEARQAQINGAPTDLFDLAAKCQEMEDLRAELVAFDAAKLQKDLVSYKNVVGQVTEKVKESRAIIARVPASAIQAELQAALDDLAAKIKPADQIGGPQALNDATLKLQKAYADYTAKQDSPTKALDDIDTFLNALDMSKTLFDAKVAEANALPPSPIRTALLSSLNALYASSRPITDAGSLKELEPLEDSLSGVNSKLRNYDIAGYQAQGTAYEAAVAAWQAQVAGKAAEVAALPNGPVKTTLQASLDQIKAQVLPLGMIKTPREITERTAALAGLEAQVKAVDPAGVADLITAHQGLVLSAKAAIDARMSALGATLSKGAVKLLRDGLMREYTPLVTFASVAELKARCQSLTALEAKATTLQVSGSIDAAAFAEADKNVAATQSRIKKLKPVERQKKAQTALNDLQLMLDQIRIGAEPEAIPKHISIGSSKAGKRRDVFLKPQDKLKAADKAVKALRQMLADDAGKQMLDFEGGEKIAEDLAKMYSSIVMFGANHKAISPAEALAIRAYTGKDYSAMNLNRRDQIKDDRLAFLNQTCDAALAKLPEYPPVAWPVFRAETAWSQDVVDKRYAKGREFKCGVLWSTGARGVADISKGSPRFLHVIYGSKGRDVAALSATPGEGADQQKGFAFNPEAGRGEVLFPADSFFVVQDRKDPPGAPESIRYSTTDNKDIIIETKLREIANG